MTLPSAEKEDGLDANISAFPHPHHPLLHHTGVFLFGTFWFLIWYLLVPFILDLLLFILMVKNLSFPILAIFFSTTFGTFWSCSYS